MVTAGVRFAQRPIMENVLTILSQRGFVSQKSHEELAHRLDSPLVLYAGFDPTAESLHIGNLLQIMLLAQMTAE